MRQGIQFIKFQLFFHTWEIGNLHIVPVCNAPTPGGHTSTVEAPVGLGLSLLAVSVLAHKPQLIAATAIAILW